MRHTVRNKLLASLKLTTRFDFKIPARFTRFCGMFSAYLACFLRCYLLTDCRIWCPATHLAVALHAFDSYQLHMLGTASTLEEYHQQFPGFFLDSSGGPVCWKKAFHTLTFHIIYLSVLGGWSVHIYKASFPYCGSKFSNHAWRKNCGWPATLMKMGGCSIKQNWSHNIKHT